MRIKLKLQTNQRTLLFSHKYHIQSFIYRCIKENEKLLFLHDQGIRLENRPFKLFIFSDIIAKAELNQSQIPYQLNYLSDGSLFIASLDDRIIEAISRYVDTYNHLIIGNQTIPVLGYEIMAEEFAQKDQYEFKTLSPITIYRKDGDKVAYYSPQEEGFFRSLLVNLQKKYYLYFKAYYPEMEIVEIKEVVVRKPRYKDQFVIAYDCTVVIKNLDKNMMKIILNAGLGAKNSIGLGMVKLVD